MRDEGKSAAEIEETINELKTHVNTSFVPDQLDYLHKGGRCSGMVMFVANALKIHPKIVMNDGQLVQGGKYRGTMARCITQYVQDLKNQYPSYDKTRCFVTHSSADKELVDVAKAAVAEHFEFDEVIETVAGSIITSHCGKGTLGVLFITINNLEKRREGIVWFIRYIATPIITAHISKNNVYFGRLSG